MPDSRSTPTDSTARTAYVVHGYGPNGGYFMAYHLARILHLDFGYEVCVLTDGEDLAKGPAHGVFKYEPLFPRKPLSEAVALVRPEDVLICNPSFSFLNFGLKIKGFKIMYIQGFSTYALLDCFFDHYVTVSPFTHDHIKTLYNIETTIIPPFIQDDVLEPGSKWPVPAWEERKPFSLALSLKGDPEQQSLLLSRLIAELRAVDGELASAINWKEALLAARQKVPHAALMTRIAASRYFLTLSVTEGFGLVPLEAMAMGTTVMGFDGYGGRAYMQDGVNCTVRPYPDIPGLARRMIEILRDPAKAESLAAAGRRTAARYNYETFRKAWVEELRPVLPTAVVAAARRAAGSDRHGQQAEGSP